jgi:hypothetical protein
MIVAEHIRLRGGMLNLTDMWKAAGRPENRRPSDWLPLEETQRFRIHAGTHVTAADDPVAANAGPAGICEIDTDGLVAATRPACRCRAGRAANPFRAHALLLGNRPRPGEPPCAISPP